MFAVNPTLSLALVTAIAATTATCAKQRPSSTTPAPYEVEDVALTAIQRDLSEGRITSSQLVELYRSRIADIDTAGPELRSVLALNPSAPGDAAQLDAERATGRIRGPLHGVPILIKDNIEMAGPLPTTAGSLALEANVTGRDAAIVAKLRSAGGLLLGKTNLSEWANIRSPKSTSGWSALGGLTRNPYLLDHNACGSSSGSGVAVAASLAAAAIGTETDGSVICPAAVNGLVGLKPTVGLVSRRHIIPISSAQDTAGPMTRTVADAATLLTVIAGSDEHDPATHDADARRVDYVKGLSVEALRGKRLGLARFLMGYDKALDSVFEDNLRHLEAAGATIVRIERAPDVGRLGAGEIRVLLTDFRQELNAYLSTTPARIPVRSLADLIAFNATHAAREMPHFRQEFFEQSEATAQGDPAEYARLRASVKAAAASALNDLFSAQSVDALIAPSTGPAWRTDLVNGDAASASATALPAMAGYPHLTVPMGFVSRLPVGMSFIGPAWSEATILSMGYAFEQRAKARRPPSLTLTSSSRADSRRSASRH